MLSIGRIITKSAGREKGRIGIIIDIIDDNYVLVDGNLKRKKCNKKHLEPLPQIVEVTKQASTDEVKKCLSSIGYKILEKTKKNKKGQTPDKNVNEDVATRKNSRTKFNDK